MSLLKMLALPLAIALVLPAQDRSSAPNHLTRIHPALQHMAPQEMSTVIVLHRDAATPGAGHRIQGRTGLNLHTHFDSIGQSIARLSRAEMDILAGDPEVEYIAPTLPVQAFAVDKGPESVGAYSAYQAGYNGSGIAIAIIDSGVSYHNCDLSLNCGSNSRYAGQISFVKDLNGSWTAPDDGQDYFGHGSHVASIALGSGTFSTNYVNSWGIYPNYWIHGVAPNANLFSLRVLDNTGAGTDASVIAAINWVINYGAQYNIRVINLSLGRPFTTSYTQDPLCQAAEKAWKAGIVVVVAAGNFGRSSSGTKGYGTITAPGNDPYVITVGAVNTRGTTDRTKHVVTSYSSKGPTAIDHIAKPDIVAPGNNIYSTQCAECPLVATYPNNKVMDTDYAYLNGSTPANGWYLRLSGTRMATPMVSGAAALLLQKNPSLTPDQVKGRLMKTAIKSNFASSYTATDASTGATYVINHDLFTIGAGEL